MKKFAGVRDLFDVVYVHTEISLKLHHTFSVQNKTIKLADPQFDTFLAESQTEISSLPCPDKYQLKS
jgi:hypothetical protein